MMVSKVVALSVALILTAVIERPQPIAGAKLGQREAVRDWIVVREPKTSDESIAHCQSLGREMVYILTEEDAEYYSEITKDIDMTGSEHGYIRIGLQSPNKDCQWSWVGSSQPFEPGTWFWQGGEPNGCRRNELCAQNGRGGKRWNDSKCYYKTFFVCGNPAATCTDDLQNQGETGVDCGGPCDACQTCDDGIQNQGEDGIDCGGPCDACIDTSEETCQDINALCKMEPAFLLDILCQIETVSQQCPKRCNSCPEIETTTTTTTTTTTKTTMPVCERKYNGYYSYGDCGGQNGVNSFEECCELAKAANINRRLENRAEIIRFSWNGNSCAFKCGGTQDNRGGSWWSSAEDISTCTCN